MCKDINWNEDYEFLSRPDIDGAKYQQRGIRFNPVGKRLNCKCHEEVKLDVAELSDEAQMIEEDLNDQEEPKPKWICDFCKFEAKSRRGLEIHVNAKHKDTLMSNNGLES